MGLASPSLSLGIASLDSEVFSQASWSTAYLRVLTDPSWAFHPLSETFCGNHRSPAQRHLQDDGALESWLP
jgi:hypothetical protein